MDLWLLSYTVGAHAGIPPCKPRCCLAASWAMWMLCVIEHGTMYAPIIDSMFHKVLNLLHGQHILSHVACPNKQIRAEAFLCAGCPAQLCTGVEDSASD